MLNGEVRLEHRTEAGRIVTENEDEVYLYSRSKRTMCLTAAKAMQNIWAPNKLPSP